MSLELSLICVCTNRKQQIPKLSMCCEYKLRAQRDQGIWTEKGRGGVQDAQWECGGIREVEKRRNTDRRLEGKDRAEEEEMERDWVSETDGRGDWSSQSLRTAVL